MIGMRYVLSINLGFEIEDDFMDGDGSFDEGVLNGNIKITDVNFKVNDGETEEDLDMNMSETEALEIFAKVLNEKAGAK
jgi:hypothetical protein